MSELQAAQAAVETPAMDSTPTEAPVQSEGSATEQKANAKAVAQAKALPKEYDTHEVEIVIDGKSQKMTVGELKKIKQLEAASNKRFQEASEREKKLMSFLNDKKERPEELLAQLGIDPDEWAERRLQKIVEMSQMSPEQRKAAEERAQFEEERKSWESQVESRVRHEIDSGITEAFKATGLPKSPFLIARMAALVNDSLIKSQKNPNVKALSFQDAAVMVKSWYRDGLKQTLSGLSQKDLAEYLGADILKLIREHELSQLGTPKPQADSGPIKASSKQAKLPVAKTQAEWRQWVDSL